MRFVTFSAAGPLLALGMAHLAGAQFVVTSGVRSGVDNQTGARPYRMEINDLYANSMLWSLYIQALTAMQQESENDTLSYFQICGIHGRPYIAFDGVAGSVTYPTGYCTHNSPLFPTWHRGYLALYEQRLNQVARTIANQYTGNSSGDWKAAARSLRCPYWDWALNSSIPEVVASPNVFIITASGAQSVSNPLYQYTYPYRDPTEFPPSQDGFLATEPTTTRDANADILLKNDQLTTSLYYLLTHVSSYLQFATTAVSGSSLEGIHNIIHTSVGGSFGVMSYLSYAAFDPIFMLHHTNCDRIFAIFQFMYPDLWLLESGLADGYGTFAIAPGTVENNKTPLAPFRRTSSGQLWDSDGVRSLATFDYSYPGMDYWNQTQDQLQNSMIAMVNEMYGPPSNAVSRRDVSCDDTVKEWFVEVAASMYALNGSYSVCFFIGELPVNSTSWRTEPKFVSTLIVFAPPPGPAAPSTGATTYGSIPLRDVIRNAPCLDAGDANAVSQYLAENLVWGIEMIAGGTVDAWTVSDLMVQVVDEDVQPSPDKYTLPEYGNKTYHPEITVGKPGGGGC